MSLVRIRDLKNRAARTLALNWFDRLAAEFGPHTAIAGTAAKTLESHLIDALQGRADASAVDVERALSELGDPAQLAADWIENHAEAAIGRGRVLVRAVVTTVTLVGGLVGGLLLLGGVVRLLDPGAVGLFAIEGGSILIGTPTGETISQDLLGGWTAPVFLIGGLVVMGLSIEASRLWLLRQLRRQTA